MHVKPARLTVAFVAAVSLTAPLVPASPGHAESAVAADPAVVSSWNAIAARTIYTENATPVPGSGMYFAFMHLAIYDAVVAIEGGYEPYALERTTAVARAYAKASPEVAAATAAYRTLRHYFPSSAANLRNDYESFLDGMPTGAATALGKHIGQIAASQIIRLRRHDGRNAPVTYDAAPAPGVWRPTPDAFAPFAVPWMGFMKPLLLDSPTQIPLPGPDAITTAAYAVDFAEVKAYGGKEGSQRSAAQTETALFFSDNPIRQYNVGLHAAVADRGLDIVETARAFAILDATITDALIAGWRSKFDDAYWRPITAIRLADTDGNAATEPDATWTPLVPTPPYPDYVSGHAPVSGATSGTLSYLFGAETMDFDVVSLVTGTTRNYNSADSLDEDTRNARIWLGIHFRKAMTDGNQLGHDVSEWATTQYFQPTD